MLIHFFAAVVFFLNLSQCSVQHLNLFRNQICNFYVPFISKVFVFTLFWSKYSSSAFFSDATISRDCFDSVHGPIFTIQFLKYDTVQKKYLSKKCSSFCTKVTWTESLALATHPDMNVTWGTQRIEPSHIINTLFMLSGILNSSSFSPV